MTQPRRRAADDRAMADRDYKPVKITLTLETAHLKDWRAIAAELGCESLEQFVGFTVDNKVTALVARRKRDD